MECKNYGALKKGQAKLHCARSFRNSSVLSMANSGPHTNGCQFFITTAPAEFLDGKHVCFGKILDDPENMLILRKVENVPTGPNNRPKLPVKISGMWPWVADLNELILMMSSYIWALTPTEQNAARCNSKIYAQNSKVRGVRDECYSCKFCIFYFWFVLYNVSILATLVKPEK